MTAQSNEFVFLPLRLEFRARDAMRFPPGKSANVLRGALGMALDQELFSPRLPQGPSGLADPPRPFVFRCRHLDGVAIQAGASFRFDINLFLPEARDSVVQAAARSAPRGAELVAAAGDLTVVDLSPRSEAPSRIRVEFLTPTELKHEGRIVDLPDFPVLFARVRDRVSSLRAIYGTGPLHVDFAALGARAAHVEMAACETRWVDVKRRSSRTGQTHPIGGFTGFAEYEGALGEFLPFLEAARWTGVGRQAVWGKGEISVASA